MFLTTAVDTEAWGAGAAGSPVIAAPYWFGSSKEQPRLQALSPILVFMNGVRSWSDGTPADTH